MSGTDWSALWSNYGVNAMLGEWKYGDKENRAKLQWPLDAIFERAIELTVYRTRVDTRVHSK